MFTLEGSVIHQRGLNVNRVSRKKKLSTGQHVIRWRAAASERIMGITSFGGPFCQTIFGFGSSFVYRIFPSTLCLNDGFSVFQSEPHIYPSLRLNYSLK